MKILIDGDGCPVVPPTIAIAKTHGLRCCILYDSAHTRVWPDAETIVVSQGADSVDFALVNRVDKGDIIITQDYGLAALVLAKGGKPLRQDGLIYDEQNIDALLSARHAAQKLRRTGRYPKGPAKRTSRQNQAFVDALTRLIAGEEGTSGLS